MAESMRSEGERLFEQYLNTQGLNNWEFEKQHPNKNKRPDYTVKIDREYIFEVKEFQAQILQGDFGWYDPYEDIRRKINEGREKFREYKDWPCVLVLYNDGNTPLVDLQNPHIMFGVMLGNVGITMPYNPSTGSAEHGAEHTTFFQGGKMIRPKTTEPQNTTISALLTVRRVNVGRKRFEAYLREMKEQPSVKDFDRTEQQIGVVVWENPFATIPLPRNILCGPYDERYGTEGNYLTRVFAGSGIVELENLFHET